MDDAAPQAAGDPERRTGTPLVRSCAVCHTLYEIPAPDGAPKPAAGGTGATAPGVSGPERGRDRFCSKACRRLAQRQHRS